MKRLWMRLGLVAGILGVGGAGVLVAQKSGTTPEPKATVASAEEAPTEGETQPRPIPITNDSYGDTSTDATSPTSTTNVAVYSNELESEDSSGAARFVDKPSPYASSPASYSINDTDAVPAPPSSEYADTTSLEGTGSNEGYVPTSSYSSDYSTTSAPPESGYSSRYGDPTNNSDVAADTTATNDDTSTSQGYATTDSSEGYGGGYAAPSYQNEISDDVADTTQSAPELIADSSSYGSSSESSTYYGATDATSDQTTLAPPPASTQSAADTSSYASQSLRPQATQPELLERDTVAASQLPASSYGASGVSTHTASVVASPLASDIPGDRDLEGAQTPTLTLEKRAPGEVSVGQAAPFKVIVRNVGNVTARGVVVTDRVPQGTKLVDASPDFTQTNDGALAWELGDLAPGDEAQVSIELMPTVEGEIGSVAQVTFRAQASVRTVSTKPGLVVKHTGPDKILIGEDVIFDITLSNPGTGATTGIVIEEDVPVGLAHVAGERLEYEVGTLRPQEEKRLQLILRANQAGVVQNVLRVKADAGLEVTDQSTLEVIAPQLQVAISGARTRYLERQVTYEVGVANPGTSTAYDVQLVTFLPKGLKYVSADNKGSYDPRRHAVYWSLAELPAQESGSVNLTALPIETGEQKLRVEGTANLNLEAQFEHTTNVQALTELAFSVQDVHDPIEVGSETVYEVRVVNNGNKVATNVQILAELPPQLTPTSGEGPSKVTVEGQVVSMQPLPRIAPRDEVVYRIAATGNGAGDHVIAVQLTSDEVPTPVIKQESTKVYTDR